MSIKAMKQALEALEDAASDLCSLEDYSTAFQEETITALRQAIANAEKSVHSSDTSSERVNKTEKNEHEGWYGLTKEEVDSWELPDCPTVFEFVQFIEAKLKEKNT